jgi:prolyl 4-hydroxylase
MESVLEPTHTKAVFDVVENVPGFLVYAEGVLTAQECEAVIAIAEEKGFVPAAIYTDQQGRDHFSENRKSYRCIIDSDAFAAHLWDRVKHMVPPKWKGATCVGLNERFRILRYDPGDEFKPHRDGTYMAPSGALSKLTLLLYLNEGYVGGRTEFLDKTESVWVAIPPHVGAVAIQDQDLVHCVPPLHAGRKYAIRTDVMYMPNYTKGPIKEIMIYE